MTLHPTGAVMVDRLRAALEAIGHHGEDALPELEPLYHDDVVFSDPIQTVRGRDRFMAMNRRLVRRSRELRFDVRNAGETADSVFLFWTMTLAPRVGPRLVVDGASELRLRDGLVAEHRDYWDLLGTAAGAIPGLRSVYRRAVALLA